MRIHLKTCYSFEAREEKEHSILGCYSFIDAASLTNFCPIEINYFLQIKDESSGSDKLIRYRGIVLERGYGVTSKTNHFINPI